MGECVEAGRLFDDPQVNAGHMLDVSFDPPGEAAASNAILQTKLPGTPLELDGRSPGLRRQPPRYGEHTEEILKSLVGAEQYSNLKLRGLIKEAS